MILDAIANLRQFDHYYFNNERLAIKLISKSSQYFWSLVSQFSKEQNGQSSTQLNSNIRTSELKILYKNLKQDISTKKKSYFSTTQITHCSYNGYNNKSIKITNSTRASPFEFDIRTTLYQKQQECKGYFKEIVILSIQ
ncbi:unnamed protein product (macronuclear) [Paramecium tetraurelia]|uniref:Uncharacterized protein n=1 Tax=Paramecium tetraurelia TaxID=5888 RepID=A0CD81_PARTE|nr:uncharacterized protein GSPATT00006959001 [Paramecium tetraurelia]CAK68748.1 unnamed protein product [Paramecium tetraurelia]|eukprot:XP_001436145.1 hypothetical protein (macronuclear) [Paramecium tetraurelia strain d4-2]